ncbi:MAG TPA: DDE-type integrase/transposase/recombinase, partial [Candidatus Pacearchaeota archaeon]|nr:DDE-type integrase/transposase/recombinase [Candidatus Pacearchaeota archaeon]
MDEFLKSAGGRPGVPRLAFPINAEGQLIQMDVKHIMLVEVRRFYQFTAIDVLSKRRVLRVYPSESFRNGAQFLQECLEVYPCPIQAIHTDNGSTFLKEFDRLGQELKADSLLYSASSA